jgi:hypothetical protein
MAKGAAVPGDANWQRGSKTDPRDDEPGPAPITLAAAGIGKHLAQRAREAAALPEDKFEDAVFIHARRALNPTRAQLF